MDSYRYQTLTTDISELAKESFVDRMNRMGAEGWKLVSAVQHERHGYSHEVHLMFMKRIRPTTRS